ncbi:D-methionine ABC transporter permease protein MetI [Gottschalkia acidurici 9a]|uniref:D-methionine ABC transporter permease protein MetI n=1 Tax=Gottschalkia acidurici (strain ATCC 7906 / DSM 604 / BCRC 14475 / CIP 104303 / KCTC 5404 / NCIMB 10678 / 9a) TaxID=1128398 RepID=K0B0W6_GOTA9|nr:methionine ABC transporter permease [Gottschalkia acidurici]AFS79159.1 D-methionine ABC transporter permease protein MetI [Gottschalkia acidurici 9a]
MNTEIYEVLTKGLVDTLYMLVITSIIAIIIGLPLGTALVVTEKNNIYPLPKLNSILSGIINFIRSLPQVILIIILLPVARLIIGTTIGANAAIVSLSIGSAPFIARIIETSLKEVEYGKIEAALAMGASPRQIILKVLIPEALSSLFRGVTIGIIGIIGLTAIAGSIGAGGLGSVAIRFGYHRYRTDILAGTVILLVILVYLVQFIGDFLAKRIDKKRYKIK